MRFSLYYVVENNFLLMAAASTYVITLCSHIDRIMCSLSMIIICFRTIWMNWQWDEFLYVVMILNACISWIILNFSIHLIYWIMMRSRNEWEVKKKSGRKKKKRTCITSHQVTLVTHNMMKINTYWDAYCRKCVSASEWCYGINIFYSQFYKLSLMFAVNLNTQYFEIVSNIIAHEIQWKCHFSFHCFFVLWI